MNILRNYHICKILLWCLKANLNSEEIDIIIWRFGYKKTLEEVSKKCLNRKVTRERIRQIQEVALSKLKVFVKINNIIIEDI